MTDLKYFEFLTEDDYSNVFRDDCIEVLVTSRFSKIREVSDAAKKMGDLADLVQAISDEQVLDSKSKQAIDGFSKMQELSKDNGISCVFEFQDNKYPIVASLDEQCFCVSSEQFVGEVYLLCKIQRKIEKGKSIKLDEIFGSFKNLPLNREQKRKHSKNIDNPGIIKDVIKGPALVAIPIAVYQ